MTNVQKWKHNIIYDTKRFSEEEEGMGSEVGTTSTPIGGWGKGGRRNRDIGRIRVASLPSMTSPYPYSQALQTEIYRINSVYNLDGKIVAMLACSY